MDNTGYTYLIQQGECLKIGYATDVYKRIKQYNTHNINFKLLYTIVGNHEKELHQKFEHLKIKTEWFKYENEIIDYFKQHGIDENYFYLNENLFASAIDKLTGNAIKFFGICLKHSRPDQGEGNYFVISDHYLQEDLSKKSLFANRSKYIKELLDNGFIYKIRRCQYGINPQIAYCGDRHSRAKLILKIIHEPTDKIFSDTKE